MRKLLVLYLIIPSIVLAGEKHKQKPEPKICLTSGCNWQIMALSLGSAGGSVQMARTGQGNNIQTSADIRRSNASIEAAFGAASSDGYVSYSSIPTLITAWDNDTRQNSTFDFDKMVTKADRSIPVSQTDVDFVAGIIKRLRDGKYRVPDFKWTLVPTKTLNSMAFPDPPFVFVFTDLLDELHRDPDQVAFVIGHEIGHMIDAQSCSGSGVAHNAAMGIKLAEDQFTKFCENHADNIGLQLVAGAGFDPAAAIKTFEALELNQKQQGIDSVSAFFGNHPLNSSRIENVEKLLPIIKKEVEKIGR